MDLLFIEVAVLLCGGVLVLALLVYLLLYKVHINKILTEEAPKGKKWCSPASLLAWLPLALLVFAIAVSLLDLNFDISGSRLTTREEILAQYANAAEQKRGSEGWETYDQIMTMTEEFALVLSYPDDHSDSQFDIYRNSEDGLTNYASRMRLSLTAVERGVMMVECDGAMLFGSLNGVRVAKIVADDGTVYELDPNEPFVLVIPGGCSRLLEKSEDDTVYVYGYSGFTAYDEFGNEMDLLSLEWYELSSIG